MIPTLKHAGRSSEESALRVLLEGRLKQLERATGQRSPRKLSRDEFFSIVEEITRHPSKTIQKARTWDDLGADELDRLEIAQAALHDTGRNASLWPSPEKIDRTESPMDLYSILFRGAGVLKPKIKEK